MWAVVLLAMSGVGAAASEGRGREASADIRRDRFLTVEATASALTVLDGERLEPLHRFPSRPALRGTPQFTRDGRFAFIVSADGWITKLDLDRGRVIAETRTGGTARDVALSGDDRFVAVASASPAALVLFDADSLTRIKVVPVDAGAGLRAVAVAPPRQSFIAVPDGLAELWEISYSDNPPHRGWVHDYRDDGMPAQRPRFPVRRMEQKSDFDDIFFDDSFEYVVATARGTATLHVVDLYIGRRFAEIALPEPPQLGASARWRRGAATILAVPSLASSAIHLIDTTAWQTIGRIALPGRPGLVRSPAAGRHAWAAIAMGPGRDMLQLIDKATLALAQTLRPAPGRRIAQIEFDRPGRRAIVSLAGEDGLLVVYDVETLAELRRIALPGPAAVYSVGARAASQ